MARQDLVRALVPAERLEDVVAELEEQLGLDVEAIEVDEVQPGVYRDEQPDRELRGLVRAGRSRTAVGAAGGALIGIALALLVPALREWAPFSVVLFAFGAAWAAAAVVAARTVQLHRDEGDRPEKLHRVAPQDAAGLRLMTIRAIPDRTEVSDHLADRGLVLLDTSHPRVGDQASWARPAGPDAGTAGPPAE